MIGKTKWTKEKLQICSKKIRDNSVALQQFTKR